MKKNISTIFFAMATMVAMADNVQLPSYTEWHDMQVNELNRLPVHTSFFPFADEAAAIKNEPRESESYLSLNGTWRFRWVENADERPAEFYLSDLDDSWWNTIQVPGMWELQGYGDPIYVNSGFGWNGHFKNNPPEVPVKDNHVGSYRRWVDIPAAWDGRQVIIHFGSVTSNIYLYVNGLFVGYAEDSKVAAEFDVTPYLKPGKNLIAFQTFRWSDGSYCEDQDFWRFSGVARDSYLYCRDRETHLDDIRITSDLTDNYKNGYLKIATKATGNATVGYRLLDADVDSRDAVSLHPRCRSEGSGNDQGERPEEDCRRRKDRGVYCPEGRIPQGGDKGRPLPRERAAYIYKRCEPPRDGS